MRAQMLALVVCCATSAALAAPAPPPELEAARKALAAAVKAHDRKAIVALSRFPIEFSGYEAPDKITMTDFLSDEGQYSALFYDGGDQIVSCLATAPLEYQAENPDFPASPWVIDCTGNEYYFGLVDGAWRFTSYMNINE